MCAKIGPCTNRSERDAAGFLEDFRAGDVGRHQIRRELDALEAQVQDLGDGPDEQRLRQTRHARQQAVATGEERDEHLVHGIVLPDDHLAKLGANPGAAIDNAGDDLFGGCGDGHGRRSRGGAGTG